MSKKTRVKVSTPLADQLDLLADSLFAGGLPVKAGEVRRMVQPVCAMEREHDSFISQCADLRDALGKIGELKKYHAELGELLKYHELNKCFPPGSYAAKWDYETALHIWVKLDNMGAAVEK